MGAGASTSLSLQVKKFIQTEFDRVRKQSHGERALEYLNLEQMALLTHPPILPIDFTHLGTLFVINSKLDGKFTLQNVISFVELCESRRKLYEPHDFLYQMQGFCTLRMFEYAQSHGAIVLENWLFQCVRQNGALLRCDRFVDVLFVLRDNLIPLYKVLRIDRAFSISFQDIFDMMQCTAEESCGLDIMPEEFDDVVPESIIRCFLSYVVGGVMQTMHDVGFGPNVNTVSLREISSAAPL